MNSEMNVNKSQQQKAIRIHEFGGIEKLVYENVPLPNLGPDDVLVKVKAAAVNPVDWKIREGYLKGFIDHQLPLVLGWDFSGEIVALGAQVVGWELGDAVFARPDISRDGSCAEYIAVRASEIALKPLSLDWQSAAAVPLTALTAWQALFEHLEIKAGDRIFIPAGAGGVGSFAIQLAKWKGAFVISSCSTANVELLKSLGADEVIDYTKDDSAKLRDLDAVLDTLGGQTLADAFESLKSGGRLVSISSSPNSELAKTKGIEASFCFVQPNARQLHAIAELIDSQKIRVLIDSVYALKDVALAHTKSQTGRARGKIVVAVS